MIDLDECKMYSVIMHMYTYSCSAGKNSRFNRMHTYTGIDGDTLGGEDYTSGLYSPAAKDTNLKEKERRRLNSLAALPEAASQPPREVRRGQRGHQCMYFNWQNETHSRATTTTNSPRFYFFCFGLSARLYQAVAVTGQSFRSLAYISNTPSPSTRAAS